MKLLIFSFLILFMSLSNEEYQERLKKITLKEIDYDEMDRKVIEINKKIEEWQENKKKLNVFHTTRLR